MTKRPGRSVGNDPGVASLLASATDAIVYVAKSWDYHVHVALGCTLEENLECIARERAGGGRIAARGDGRPRAFLRRLQGQSRICARLRQDDDPVRRPMGVLCDTNGGTLPHEIERIVVEVARITPAPSSPSTPTTTPATQSPIRSPPSAPAWQVQGTLNELGERCGNAKQIIEFAKKSRYISVYALDPLFEVFNSYTSEEPKITLVFLVNNNHLYPILDETMKRQASRTKKIELQDFKWLVDYEDYEYIENENYIDDTQKQLVLLDKKNLRDVLLKRIKDHHIMVTNIKFINSAVISFEDPFTGKIIESSIDYNLRKLACKKLYDEFLSIEEFKFKNNSFTDLSNKIFNYKFGNIPDSCYNEITILFLKIIRFLHILKL